MSPLRIVALLWVCALLRQVAAGSPSRSAGAEPSLPGVLDGAAGISVPLTSSERLLARRPGVALERRRYGSSEVALLSSLGLKELHPPSVCLRASGLEIVERGEERSGDGCLAWLRVSGKGREQHLTSVFFDGRTQTCSFWRRTLIAFGQQLAGRPRRWSTLQVMDPDRARARRRLLVLLAGAASTGEKR